MDYLPMYILHSRVESTNKDYQLPDDWAATQPRATSTRTTWQASRYCPLSSNESLQRHVTVQGWFMFLTEESLSLLYTSSTTQPSRKANKATSSRYLSMIQHEPLSKSWRPCRCSLHRRTGTSKSVDALLRLLKSTAGRHHADHHYQCTTKTQCLLHTVIFAQLRGQSNLRGSTAGES